MYSPWSPNTKEGRVSEPSICAESEKISCRASNWRGYKYPPPHTHTHQGLQPFILEHKAIACALTKLRKHKSRSNSWGLLDPSALVWVTETAGSVFFLLLSQVWMKIQFSKSFKASPRVLSWRTCRSHGWQVPFPVGSPAEELELRGFLMRAILNILSPPNATV